MNRKIRVLINKILVAILPTFIIKKITTCKDITYRVADPDAQTFWQKVDTKFHLLICPPCWDYSNNMNLVKKGLKKYILSQQGKADIKRIDELSTQIIEKHKKAQ